ncbi:hypothetical protein KDAU_57810 [Dictyobacter aurantiacus]|uniref:Uncharacterized protein n=1 Tax=Dictyobacter aurantiacus TaxID=1936993 RepID=A0A401ZNM4_9CHLR|nr:hypothetical protein KDAU_57810 [Dictyobacter aurantiacus]
MQRFRKNVFTFVIVGVSARPRTRARYAAALVLCVGAQGRESAPVHQHTMDL